MKLTTEELNDIIKPFSGTIHGDTLDGEWDVEFTDMVQAMMFHTFFQYMTIYGPQLIDIRKGDSISTMHTPVTLTIRPIHS